MVIELTDGAISKAIERTETGNRSGIRLGVTGGGCAGFEYYIEYVESIAESDTVLDYGKFNIVVDAVSLPYLEGSTLDWVVDGINEYFKIINPKEVSSCVVACQFSSEKLSSYIYYRLETYPGGSVYLL